MPKIDIPESLLTRYLGQRLTLEKLEELLPVAKAELDGIDEEHNLLKIELNDTNRPDLWSVAGLARQLRTYLNGNPSSYDFFSTCSKKNDPGNRRIEVHESMKDIRPYIATFAAEGEPVDDPFLKALIQSQEKLCNHYGRNRETIAMGIYCGDRIEYPVHYLGAEPEVTCFHPLEAESEMSLQEIIERHPKGIEYGHIISGYKQYPFLEDSQGNCLSFPPIINSNYCGAVGIGDRNLFVELTGTDMNTILTATAIIACDMADAGYRILPVQIIYPYDTPYGREMITPYYFQRDCSVHSDDVCRILGESLSGEEISESLKRMDHQVRFKDRTVFLSVPPYRNDFMHGVDIIEEIMIGYGIDRFNPTLPEEFTIGSLSPLEETSRKLRDLMIGLGYQEMMYHYLGSKEDIIDKMGVKDEDVVEIANPKSQRYGMIRNSIFPNLLHSEAVSAQALYPHKIFEIGCVVKKEHKEYLTTSTKHCLGLLRADTAAGFNEINEDVSALLFYLNVEYTLKALEDGRFIQGRCAAIMINNRQWGLLGELHPGVLQNWHIEMPCAVAEMDISALGCVT